MIVLITGSDGIIGKPLTERLIKDGHIVYTLDKNHSSSATHYRCDVGSYRELQYVFRQICEKHKKPVDYVYHLAAEVARLSGELYYEKIWQTNTIGVRNLCELQKEGFFDKFIFFSSSEVYGDLDKQLLEETDTENYPVFPRNDYGLSKWTNEIQLRNHVNVNGLPVMVIRIFTAYGPNISYTPYRGVIYDFVWNALHNKPYKVYSDYSRTFMYMSDFIDTLSNIVNYSLFYNGAVNVGTQEEVTMRQLSEMVLTLTDTPKELAIHLEKDSPLTIKRKNPSIEIAKKYLKHAPKVTLQEGVSSVINYLQSQMSL